MRTVNEQGNLLGRICKRQFVAVDKLAMNERFFMRNFLQSILVKD